MIRTTHITQVPASRPDLYAFRINGEVAGDEMETMAHEMNAAFDRHEQVDMLLIFDRYEGSETGASWNMETIKANFRSLSKVSRHVVAGAPDSASSMLETMGKIMPVETETFRTEAEAWAALDASPAAGGPVA